MNTLEGLRQAAAESRRKIGLDDIRRIVSEVAPEAYNQILIDETLPLQQKEYCYIHAFAQQVVHKSEVRACACDKQLEQRLSDLLQQPGSDYIRLDDEGLIEAVKAAPRFVAEGVIRSTRRKMSELMNGGREVNHADLRLVTDDDGTIAATQPSFLVRTACHLANCPQCNGTGKVEPTDSNGVMEPTDCPECEGNGRVAALTYFRPEVKNHDVCLTVCLDGGIDGLKERTIEAHRGDDTTPCRMAVHINGTDIEHFDEFISPYLDHIYDQTGTHPELLDIYYRLVTCVGFRYRNVLTGDVLGGVVVDTAHQPEVVLGLGADSRLVSGMKDSIKRIGNLLGGLSRSKGHRDKEDLLRTTRLLIAVAVADGIVDEEEKRTLTLSIRDIDDLTSSEQENLLALLGAADSSFLSEADFRFHRPENAQSTLALLQQLSEANGQSCEEERSIIERLRTNQ